MELLGDVGHVKSHFGLFGDSVNLDTGLVHGLHRMCNRHINHFRCNRWYSYVTRIKWKLVSICLETVLILMQDRCMVCAEHTIGSEISLDAPDGTPR